MKEIFEQYGGMMITIVAILTVVVVVRAVIGTDGTGYMGKAFAQLLDTFMSKAQMAEKGFLYDGTEAGTALGIVNACKAFWL